MTLSYDNFRKVCEQHKYEKNFDIDMGDGFIARFTYSSNFINTDEMTYSVYIYKDGQRVFHCEHCASFCRNNKINNHALGCWANIMNGIAVVINKSLRFLKD